MGVEIRVTIENLASDSGVAFSPFTLVAHDGTLDGFDVGSAASQGIEDIAELGDGTVLIGDVMTAQPTAQTATLIATSGGVGPGIFAPGASGSFVLTLDPAMNRYLSYGAMVVPSNDAFFGNDSPTEVELFDAMGNFVATNFTLIGSDIWDAGSEVNQLLGSAYVVGQDATLGDDEGGVVQMANLATQFSAYDGSMTPPGATFSDIPTGATPIASFSFEVVPEPSTLTLAIMGGIALVVIGRRRWATRR
jgi:hypothetical protein